MGKRILVADDSLTIQKAFAMVLSGQDYTLVFARSVDEALAAAKSGRPDLVYADAVMGTSSGYDLCASIKSDPGLRGVPVRILASNQNPYDEARALRVGADGCQLKPFDSQGLLDGVVAALNAPVSEPAPARVAPGPVVSAATRPAPAAPWPVEKGNTTEEIEPTDDSADDDSYGEFTIERSSAPTPAASWAAKPPTWPGSGSRTATPTPPAAVPPSRPSLIPGVAAPTPASPGRPGPALPGVIPAPPPSGIGRATATRTIMGFPSAGPQSPASAKAATPAPPTTVPPMPAKPIVPRPSSPVPAPVMPRPTPPPPTAALTGAAPAAPAPVRRTGSMAIPVPQAAPAPAAAAVSSAIDQKVAALAARGKEYEAIAKLSREIIEQVVWEVVPELAEVIIKQEIDRLVAAKR